MTGAIRELRSSLEDSLGALGRYALFAGRLAAEVPRALLRFRLVVEQVHNAGALSLVIIMLSGLFVGTALASELGLMRATDQIAAIEMMAVDPVRRVVMPRFLGGVIAMPLLAAIFSMIGLYGAQLVGVQLMGVDQGQFWSQMRGAVELGDVMEGVLKSVVFGFACSLVAVYEGYHSQPTAEGVGRATTRTVVISSVSVLLLDYMLTAVML
jgi:phospholipid/cholesterol/gamma-HCH transport system permease protein